VNLKTLDFSALSEFLVVTRGQTISIEIERVGTIQNTLGSGPVWDTAEKALYWVDGTAAEIYRLDPRPAISNHGRFPPRSALSALREKDGAVLALENGFQYR
jgi:L-arabinonolactonase